MSKWLLLIPTEFERCKIAPELAQLVQDFSSNSPAIEVVVETCGFGPVVSAARTANLIALHQPDQVLILGIAGAYAELEIGKAFQFASVACHGVGVGTGEAFQTAEEMGWAQTFEGIEVGNPLALRQSEGSGVSEVNQLLLLTVCATSAHSNDVRDRKNVFPEAQVEDMESYSVAVACQLLGRKLTVVRGISNAAGERDKSKWEIKLALESAVALARKLILESIDE